MKFSIIIPIYNGSPVIERCLASLISSRQNIEEVIIVDDFSDDDFRDKIPPFEKFFNIKVMMNGGDPHNPGASRMTGLTAAAAPWIMFVDVDDALTSSCLTYLSKIIQTHPEIKVIESQTIYYQFGSCNLDHVGVNSGSCGGRCYEKDFLLSNNLLFHDTLKMAEDQYFNVTINYYIEIVLKKPELLYTYEYPVYEVHHDYDMPSYSFTHWVDYCIKYHLLMDQYILDFMVSHNSATEEVINDGLDNFIFSYFCYQGLIKSMDKNEKEQAEKSLQYFQNFLDYYAKTFNIKKLQFIRYFKDNPETVNDIKHNAEATLGGIKIYGKYHFRTFLSYFT